MSHSAFASASCLVEPRPVRARAGRALAVRVFFFAGLGGLGGLVGLGWTERALAQESRVDGLRAVSRASPGDAAAALALGRALRRAGRAPEALSELRRGLAVSASRAELAAQIPWGAASRGAPPGPRRPRRSTGKRRGRTPTARTCRTRWRRARSSSAARARGP